MSFKINLDPFSAAPYFTVQEHLRKYNGQSDLQQELKDIELRLRELLSISSAYQLKIVPVTEKAKLSKEFGFAVLLDNPYSGRNDLLPESASLNERQMVDVSFSFPQNNKIDLTSFKVIICDSNASLGIPNTFLLVFTQISPKEQFPFQELHSFPEFRKDIYVLSGVLEDFIEKDIDVLLRESNYKAAVLYQLIDSNKNLLPIADKEYRSKSVIVAECEQDFAAQINKLGYQIYSQQVEGKTRISIANYATQSKELIEMFADRVAEL